MIFGWWKLKDLLTMSSDRKQQFKNPNYKRDCSKIGMEKIAIKYDDTIASDYE
jgi:hypothetical protein